MLRMDLRLELEMLLRRWLTVVRVATVEPGLAIVAIVLVAVPVRAGVAASRVGRLRRAPVSLLVRIRHDNAAKNVGDSSSGTRDGRNGEDGACAIFVTLVGFRSSTATAWKREGDVIQISQRPVRELACASQD